MPEQVDRINDQQPHLAVAEGGEVAESKGKREWRC